MEIRFLDHALKRMVERNLSPSFVRSAIVQPDKVERSMRYPRRFLFKKRYSSHSSVRLLIAVAEKESDALVVITVIDTSKVEKHW